MINQPSDHIVHCILTIYSLGATPEEIQQVYDREASYQKKRHPIDEEVVKSLADRPTFKSYLGQQPHYSNYLLFFQREIEKKGVKATLEEHLFAGDEHADRLFALIYNGEPNPTELSHLHSYADCQLGIFHPYLHLGYAFEYNQPAIVAEGLAMASVHDPEFDLVGPVYIDAERLAGGPRQHGKKTLRELMAGLRADKSLGAARNGENKVDRSHNVAEHAPRVVEEYTAQYSIASDQLEEKVDESIDTACEYDPLLSRFKSVVDCGSSFDDRNQAFSPQTRRSL